MKESNTVCTYMPCLVSTCAEDCEKELQEKYAVLLAGCSRTSWSFWQNAFDTLRHANSLFSYYYSTVVSDLTLQGMYSPQVPNWILHYYIVSQKKNCYVPKHNILYVVCKNILLYLTGFRSKQTNKFLAVLTHNPLHKLKWAMRTKVQGAVL